jgi:hypothetical protein
MRLIPKVLDRPRLSRISISQEEITADLRYPAPARSGSGAGPEPRRRGAR